MFCFPWTLLCLTRRGCARDIKVTVPPRLRFESVGMMCWLHNNNNSNSNKLSLTHWPNDRRTSNASTVSFPGIWDYRDTSAWITVNTVNMQSILSYRELPKGAWDTFASQRYSGKTIHESWAQQFLRARNQFVQRVIVYGHTMDLSPLEEGTRELRAAEKGEKTITKLWHNFLARYLNGKKEP